MVGRGLTGYDDDDSFMIIGIVGHEEIAMNKVCERPGIYTVAGTPDEVRRKLGGSQAEHVLALSFAHLNPASLQPLVDNIRDVTTSLFDLLSRRSDQATMQRLAEALVPQAPVSPRLLKEAAMLVTARKAVLESGDWLTAAEVAQLAGFSPRNPSAQPNRWKKQGQIFAIQHHGVDYFPAYGLAADTGFRPHKALAQIIEIFDGHKDAWGMAYWFLADNGFLGGRRPQDLLADDPDRVIAAAQDEVAGVGHG